MEIHLNDKRELFIVYKYNIYSINQTKYVVGIYETHEKARKRQFELAPEYNKHMASRISSDGNVVFINKLTFGDSNIEIFTTRV